MFHFAKKKFVSSSQANTLSSRYRNAIPKHPFVLFGLPFIIVMVGGSFVLTPVTAIRYERHDRKVRQVTKEEELSVGDRRRKVDIREEYFRLSAKDNENWDQKRVKRFRGETDGILK